MSDKKIRERVKKGTDVAMDWSKLMRGELNLTIKLPDEDKERLEKRFDRMEGHWVRTQIIMATGWLLAIGSSVAVAVL
jgi:hypothetical protein